MAERAYSLRPSPMYRGQKPIQDEAYARYIRKLFCLACGATWGIEAAHTGAHGLGQKSCGRSRIPLCRKCHRTGNESLHALGPVAFAERFQLDIPANVARLNQFYDERLAKKETPMDRFQEETAADLEPDEELEDDTPDVPVTCPVLRDIYDTSATVGEMCDRASRHRAGCTECQGLKRKQPASEGGDQAARRRA
jgi:hypothetical protein